MQRTQTLDNVSTKLQRIAELARMAPQMALRTLAHHIDVEFLRVAYQQTRKDGAVGVDKQTAAEYAANLEGNLQSLLNRFKSCTYHAPPVRRVEIPKGDGTTRRLGIPTFEDKLLQRAVAMVLSAVYEQDFLDCSHGFRPGRSAHGAIRALNGVIMRGHANYIVEADIVSFFDSIDRKMLMEMLRSRIADERLMRLVGKCLHVGILDGERYEEPEVGATQGSVLSPILGNVYLHHVIDVWFEREMRPKLLGRAELVRYA